MDSSRLSRIVAFARKALTFVVAAASLGLLYTFQSYSDTVAAKRDWESHTSRMIELGQSLISDSGESRGGLRDYDTGGDPGGLARAREARRRFEANFASLVERTRDNPRQQSALARVRRSADDVFGLLDSGDHDAVAPFLKLKADINAVVAEERGLAPGRSADVTESLGHLKRSAWVFGIPAAILFAEMVVATLAGWFFPRQAAPHGSGVAP